MPTPPRLSRFGEYCAEQTRRHGLAFDDSHLYPGFARFFNSRERVRVVFSHGETCCGWVSATTGTSPQFLLVRDSRSVGSSRLLGRDDRIVAVKRGRKYQEV